jgi:hypothetical protein
MSALTKLIIGAASVICMVAAVPPRGGSYAMQQQNDVRVLTAQERAIKVSITTGGGLFGPPRDRYRVGQRVPVSITMTNTSDQPVEVCNSGTVYQDRPKLLRDGQPVPYLDLLSEVLQGAQEGKACLEFDLSDPIILKPKEERVVDWLILAEGNNPMGDMAWYEPLGAGKYELSIQCRVTCCDGPMLESNKISFEVVP